MTVKILKVVYMEQPFTPQELETYDSYFLLSNHNDHRVLNQESIRTVEDDYYTYTTTTDEEICTYINEEQYENFKNKLGECYELLLNGDIDLVEFE